MFKNKPSLTSACPFVDIPSGCWAVMQNVVIAQWKMGKKRTFLTKNPVWVKIIPKFKWGYQAEVSRDHLVKIAGIYDAPSSRLAP